MKRVIEKQMYEEKVQTRQGRTVGFASNVINISFLREKDINHYIGSAVKLRLRLDIKFDENRLFV